MKILLIEICNFDNFPTGGQLTFAKNLALAFNDNVSVVGMSTDPKEPIGKWFTKKILNTDIQYFSCGYTKTNLKKPVIPTRITNWFLLKKHIREIELTAEYDLVFIQSAEVLLSLPKRLLTKAVIRMPGTQNIFETVRYKWARPFASLYDRFFFKQIENCPLILATADTNSINDFITRSRGKIKANKVIQFPSRYNSDIFHPRNQKKSRESLSLNADEKLIVTVGRINWHKGWKFMVDSFINFSLSNPNSRLIFIGNGEDEDALEKYITEKSISDKIDLVGRKQLSDIALYLNSCDLFIMGSDLEGWSTTLVEAVASGCRCVVTKFSSAKELVSEGENGFVVDVRNELMFAQRMEEALNLSETGIKISSERIEKLSVSNLKSSFIEVIKKTLLNIGI